MRLVLSRCTLVLGVTRISHVCCLIPHTLNVAHLHWNLTHHHRLSTHWHLHRSTSHHRGYNRLSYIQRILIMRIRKNGGHEVHLLLPDTFRVKNILHLEDIKSHRTKLINESLLLTLDPHIKLLAVSHLLSLRELTNKSLSLCLFGRLRSDTSSDEILNYLSGKLTQNFFS